MGANAQTTVPTFTAGQILTADQQNQSARTGVPVFATTITRDAGFGGTGEKTLAEGQLCYVEGTGLQTYNGTAWVTWGAAPSSGALVFITSATFTASSSVAFANGVFSSTYQNYQVILNFGSSTSAANLGLQFRDNTGTKTGSNYYSAAPGLAYDGAAANNNTNLGSSIVLCPTNGVALTDTVNLIVANPGDAAVNTSFLYQFYARDRGGAGGGRYTVNEAHTGLVFTPTTGTITGTYRVYGIANS